jgi:hypothetical protein
MATDQKDKEIERLMNEHEKHKGLWLTAEAVAEYQKRARRVSTIGDQDIGARRALRKEFQEKYGLLEIEAINILNGFHGAFYVEKYRRIQSCLPWNTNPTKTNMLETED